jgi:hypothetical protein
MAHNLHDLNQWTGLFEAISAAALLFCSFCIARIGNTITRFWLDYRKFTHLKEIEEAEKEFDN